AVETKKEAANGGDATDQNNKGAVGLCGGRRLVHGDTWLLKLCICLWSSMVLPGQQNCAGRDLSTMDHGTILPDEPAEVPLVCKLLARQTTYRQSCLYLGNSAGVKIYLSSIWFLILY